MPSPKHYKSWSAYRKSMAYIHMRGLVQHPTGDVFVAGRRHHPHHSSIEELRHAEQMARMEVGGRRRDGIAVKRRK